MAATYFKELQDLYKSSSLKLDRKEDLVVLQEKLKVKVREFFQGPKQDQKLIDCPVSRGQFPTSQEERAGHRQPLRYG